MLQAKANVLMQHQQEHVKQEKENFVLCANPFIVNVHATFRKSTECMAPARECL